MNNGTPEEPNYGVKGEFDLFDILNYPNGILIDYMHLIFEGVCKFLLKKWFKSYNHKQPYYIG